MAVFFNRGSAESKGSTNGTEGFPRIESTLCLKKGTPTLSIVTLKRSNGFWRFLAQIFLKQLAIKWLFNFPPHPISASTLPGENRTNEILHFIQGSIITLLK